MKKIAFLILTFVLLSDLAKAQIIFDFESNDQGWYNYNWGPSIDGLSRIADPTGKSAGVLQMSFNGSKGSVCAIGAPSGVAKTSAPVLTYYIWLPANTPDSLHLSLFCQDNKSWKHKTETYFAKDIPKATWYPLDFPLLENALKNPAEFNVVINDFGWMGIDFGTWNNNPEVLAWSGNILIDNVSLVGKALKLVTSETDFENGTGGYTVLPWGGQKISLSQVSNPAGNGHCLQVIYQPVDPKNPRDNINISSVAKISAQVVDLSYGVYLSADTPDSLYIEIFCQDNVNWKHKTQRYYAMDIPKEKWYPIYFHMKAQDIYDSKGELFNPTQYPFGWFGVEFGTLKTSDYNWNGKIYLDDVAYLDDQGASVVTLDWNELSDALISANALFKNSTEGSGEGQFLAGSKGVLQSAINSATSFRSSSPANQTMVDDAVESLFDACIDFEKSVQAIGLAIFDSLATKETRYLYQNLRKLTTRGLMLGQQYVTGVGAGWTGDNNRSDVMDVCGDYPSFWGQDLNSVQKDWDINGLKYKVAKAYNLGAAITFNWHMYDMDGKGFYAADVNNARIASTIIPGGSKHTEYKKLLKKVGRFMKSLRGKNGESIPFVFRPFHEHHGNWFWWGPQYTTAAEFGALWQFTVTYLRDTLNVHNFITAISPSPSKNGQVYTKNSYYVNYPGDKYVDIFGTDFYFNTSSADASQNDFVGTVRIVAQCALDKEKIAAITEFGQNHMATTELFTNNILQPLKFDSLASHIVYANLWNNEYGDRYVPYTGSTIIPDFIKFYNDPYTLFTKDLPKLYQLPIADNSAPWYVTKFDTTLLATTIPFTLKVETNEKAFVQYSYTDQTFGSMEGVFETGEGSYIHATKIGGLQGDQKTLYIRSRDDFGNMNSQSLAINFIIDTTQALIPWTDHIYPTANWPRGSAPLGNSSSAITKISPVITAYFRKSIAFDTIPNAMRIILKGEGGAVLYLNNVEIGRTNLPSGGLKYITNSTYTGAFTEYLFLNKAQINALKKGINIIAIELHGTEQIPAKSIDANIAINSDSQEILPYGSEWEYFDKGIKPQDIKLIHILTDVSVHENLSEFKMYSNYPNPFNPFTVIQLDLPKAGFVKLKVFDILGREVATLMNEKKQAGIYKVKFNAEGLLSGIYIYRIVTGDFVQTRRMILMK
jgi:mannan endo-1,4-beta-mannosidase